MANERYAEFTEETPKSFVQGLFEESTTQKQRLGTVRRLGDGREFIYAKMGATVGVAGSVYQSPVTDIANIANVGLAAANVGDRDVTVTPVTVLTADAVANVYAEGFLHINTGPANGMSYKVRSHPALTANTANAFKLYDKLRSANLTTSSKATLTRHPCKDVIITPATKPTAGLVGVATFPVTANYYAWLQRRGPCAVETDGTVVAGDKVVAAATSGCVGPAANGSESDIAIGCCLANNANDHWSLIDLLL